MLQFVKTVKEAKENSKKEGLKNTSPNRKIKIKKQKEQLDRSKWYYLRHSDFPVVKNCDYNLNGTILKIKENGCIIIDNPILKDKLVGRNFYLVGVKEKKYE